MSVSDEDRFHAFETQLAVFQATWTDRNKLVDERFEALRLAVKVATETNDLRLNQIGQMISRDEAMAAIKAVNSACEAQNSFFRDKLDTIGRPNYVLVGVFVSLASILVGGIWTVGDLKIENTISPVALQIEHIRTANDVTNRDILDRNMKLEAALAEERKRSDDFAVQLAHVKDQIEFRVK